MQTTTEVTIDFQDAYLKLFEELFDECEYYDNIRFDVLRGMSPTLTVCDNERQALFGSVFDNMANSTRPRRVCTIDTHGDAMLTLATKCMPLRQYKLMRDFIELLYNTENVRTTTANCLHVLKEYSRYRDKEGVDATCIKLQDEYFKVHDVYTSAWIHVGVFGYWLADRLKEYADKLRAEEVIRI